MSIGKTGWLEADLGMIDLCHRGVPGLIASYLIPTSDGLVLIETGPSSTLETLLAGVRELGHDPVDIRHVLLTHIHLDHAGGAGSLMQRLPEAWLYVHERGARHMIDPSRLLASAKRVYGATMDALWGEVLPCPAERVTSLTDSDQLTFGDLTLDVLYTPGHASHHVAYDDAKRSVVFCGDVAGMRIPPSSPVFPPTPPPDIDVEAWHQSIERVRSLGRDRLLLAHFGPWDNPDRHLDELEARLDVWVQLVSEWRAAGFDRQEMATRLEQQILTGISDGESVQHTQEAAEFVMPYRMSINGLVRYLERRDETVSNS